MIFYTNDENYENSLKICFDNHIIIYSDPITLFMLTGHPSDAIHLNANTELMKIDDSYMLETYDEYGDEIASIKIKLTDEEFKEMFNILFKFRHEWIINYKDSIQRPRGVKVFIEKYKASLDETKSVNRNIYFDENEEDVSDLYSNL